MKVYVIGISLIVWKLCAFRHRTNLDNFRNFFYHNFRLKGKFQIRMVSSERSPSDLLESTLFQILKIIFHHKNHIFQVRFDAFSKMSLSRKNLSAVHGKTKVKSIQGHITKLWFAATADLGNSALQHLAEWKRRDGPLSRPLDYL